MSTKERIQALLASLPDDVSIEDVERHLRELREARQASPEGAARFGEPGTAAAILAAIAASPPVEEEDVQALLAAIAAGRRPVRFESPFDG